jgi:exopolyphosphatase/guanosine-5'-triphosphate,3'-diphosphate pyrophosphatase
MNTPVRSADTAETKVASAKPARGAGPNLFAVIDVGATAIRLEIAELSGDGAIRSIEQLYHAVHLGKDTFSLGRIQQSRNAWRS